MAKGYRPRRGSLAFYPRKKAKRIFPTVRAFVESDTPKILGFPCYKAGMTHIVATETYDKSPAFGQDVALPVTVLETPPIFVFGIRFYEKTRLGLRAIADIYAEKLNKDLGRIVKLPKKYDSKTKKEELEKLVENVHEFRVLAQTQPRKIKLKKTPELVELKIGGPDKKEIWKYCLDILGKEIHLKDLFEEGIWIDVTAITKGKGTQGPVKRFGIKVQRRKAKGHRRRPGAIGAWTPSRVLWTVAMAGQMGFQRRTELNKRILKIGDDGKEVTPVGGFLRYGEVIGEYALVKGSVPGPKKRLVIVRQALRGGKSKEAPLPTIKYISTTSHQ